MLALRQIRKRYGATVALDGVDLTLHAGEVLALMGANGAGKSTLVKIIAGVERADAGQVLWQSQPVTFGSPRAALSAGVVTVHQQTSQLGVPGLTVAENLLLGKLCDPASPVLQSPRQLLAEAARVAGDLAGGLPLTADFADLTTAQRQLLALARALYENARLVILDEPTASLSAHESRRLFAAVDQLRAAGIAVLYISHRPADLRRLADRAVVLRNGQVAGGFAAPLDLDAALRVLTGGTLPLRSKALTPTAPGPVRLQLDAVRLLPESPAINLTLRAGEVVALTGNLGAGKSHLLRVLFGAGRLASGRVLLNGQPWRARNPAQAIAAGVFMAAEDRWRSSFLPTTTLGATLADLIALPHLPQLFKSGWLDHTALDERAISWIARLGIRAPGPQATPDQLSGGNQQKVVLARWQSMPAQVLLLDEPFQGVDIGARHDLVNAIRASTDRAVLIATSDLEEAVEVADRVLIMDQHGIYDPGPLRDGASLLDHIEQLERFAGQASNPAEEALA